MVTTHEPRQAGSCFEDLFIEIGAKMNMIVQGSRLPVEGIFVGNRPGEYIVITPPAQIDSVSKELLGGNKVQIKYLCHGRILEFETKLIEVVHDPVQLLLLEYPKNIRECDLRSQKRINCFISAQMEVEAELNKGAITGVIKDISKSGCRILIQSSKDAEDMFRINEQISLKCHFPGVVGEQEAFGRVLDIQKKDDEIAIRIQFSDIMWWVPPYAL